MFGGGGSSSAPPLIDRGSYDGLLNLLAIMKSPGDQQAAVERFIELSAAAKAEQDRAREMKAESVATQERVRQEIQKERAEFESAISKQRSDLEAEVARRRADLEAAERQMAHDQAAAKRDAEQAAKLRADWEGRARKIQEIAAA
jgi:hypothetical protein